MRRNGLYIILVVVAVVVLAGLLILAANLDRPTGGTESSSESEEPTSAIWSTTYEEYEAMTTEEKSAFYASFDKPDDFFTWYAMAKQIYDDSKQSVTIGGDGSINLGDLINKDKNNQDNSETQGTGQN